MQGFTRVILTYKSPNEEEYNDIGAAYRIFLKLHLLMLLVNNEEQWEHYYKY